METTMLGIPEKEAKTGRGRGRKATRTVRFVKSVAGIRFDYREGEIAELVPEFAKQMIANGYAESV